MAVVEQLGDDSWSVVCAACCHMFMHFHHNYFLLKGVPLLSGIPGLSLIP